MHFNYRDKAAAKDGVAPPVHQRLCALLGQVRAPAPAPARTGTARALQDSIELTKLFHAELVLAAAGPLQTQTKCAALKRARRARTQARAAHFGHTGFSE